MSVQELFQQNKYASFINGVFILDQEVHPQTLISPVTKAPWKELVPANSSQVQEAILAADTALSLWKKTPPPQRGDWLRKIASSLIDNKALLAETMAMEMGKPINEGTKEVDYAAGFFSWFAGEAERIYGQIIPSSLPHKRLLVLQEPIGVCGIITPWNFPLAMASRKIAAALAAGCTVVCKPSGECPISMLLFAEVCREARLPPGVVNVVIGPEKTIGQEMLSSPIVRKISFTGSCEVGRYLYKESAATLKKLTLELGGHAPLLVFNDANLEKSIAGTIAAKFRNNGQTCIAANRIFVQEEIYSSYIKGLLSAIKNLTIGSPLDPKTDLSNVLHPSSEQKVKEHILEALQKGATALLQGEFAYQPAVITNVSPQMRLCREETFGPVAPIISFKTIDEGLSLANDSEYGLAAYVFTESLSIAQKSLEELQYGIIGLNDGLPSTPQASFGGFKNSGFGREGGPSGIREYLVEKYVSAVF